MFITTNQMLKVLTVVAWIIFLGVCVEAGGIIVNSFFALFINPENAKWYWEKIDLSGLLSYDRGHFMAVTGLMSIVALLRVLLFYLIVRILQNKKLDPEHPFNDEFRRFIRNVAYICIAIGFFSSYGGKYSLHMEESGISMPPIQHMRIDGAAVWVFMSVTLFIIAQLFKRGIEIQSENDLTV